MTPHTPLIEALKSVQNHLDGICDERGAEVVGNAVRTIEALEAGLSLKFIRAEEEYRIALAYISLQSKDDSIRKLAGTALNAGDRCMGRIATETTEPNAAYSQSPKAIRAGEISFTLPNHAVRFLTEMCKRERHRMARESDLSLQSEAAFDSLNTIEESLP